MNAVFDREKSSQSGDSFGALSDEKNRRFVLCVLIKENM